MTVAPHRDARDAVELRRRFNSALGAWFVRHVRRFPWRRTPSPYRVFVAETALRKTRAQDALSVYLTIVRRYPSVRALASASKAELARLIAPVGLPGRAGMMVEAARLVVTLHKGHFPTCMSELMGLPGVGEYIASAIASLAYDERTPVIDGGVARVLTRAFGLDPSRPAYRDPGVRDVADWLLPVRDVRAHNLALLDLAGIVCRPSTSHCCSCPVRRLCVARSAAQLRGQMASGTAVRGRTRE